MCNENISDLDKKRHSLAHLLAAAVKELYPNAKLTVGPAISDGFYYDIDFNERAPSDKDLPKIEKKMREILPTWEGFVGKKIEAEKAKEFYAENEYKTELIDEIIERKEEITFYISGEFTDLCRGGHVDKMSSIDPESFELDRVAGAYWRGDEANKMLTRIYGLAFENKEELESYKTQREEARERDHRKIGKELDLFTFSELVGAGLPMFTPKGTAMREAIINKIQDTQAEYGYQRVCIPHITKPDLYKTSGHWEKFGDELFKLKGQDSEFVMKPMNCPHHTQIFASSPKTYKDLPARYMEATMVYRDEQSGELLGLSRVRSITQDDGHVFCTEDQIKEEIKIIINIIREFYTSLGMWNEGTFHVSLSVRDPKTPEKYLGDDSIWNKSESALEEIAQKEKLPFERVEGDAAFYGPKLDFIFKDAIGREWQLATAQLDFNMPKRFELEYTDKDGTKKTPVMIHRAIAGSLERFMSVIIEHFAGNFPFCISPVQVVVIPIGENHIEKAKEIGQILKKENVRIEIDSSTDGFGKKVRKAKSAKVPYFIIIGDKDIEAGKVTLESRDAGNLGQLSDQEIIEKLRLEK